MTNTLMGLVVLATVLVPGWVIRQFRSRFLVIASQRNVHDNLIQLVVTGLWNFAVTWPLLTAMGVDPLVAILSAGSAPELAVAIRSTGLALFFQILVAPMILAIIVAYFERSDWVRILLRKLELAPLARRGQAWDQAFEAPGDSPCMVTVTLKDGTVLAGLYSDAAAAGRSVEERDLFLTGVLLPSNDHPDTDFAPEPGTIGLLIRADQISYLVLSELPDSFVQETQSDDDNSEDANDE